MDKISVIVPVYNAEKFIDKCIKSVLDQTYKNIELILVNDGSKDNSLEVLKKYEKKYPKIIKVFTQKNQGVSIARNVGLKNATGKFVFFLDSDDWIEKDYLHQLQKNIKNNDMIISGFKNYAPDGKINFEIIPANNTWTKFKYCSTPGKMYERQFLISNNIIFKKFKIGEDACFLLECYARTNKIIICNSTGYCHLENPTSVTHTLKKNNHNSLVEVLKYVDENVDCSNLNIKELSYFYIKSIVMDACLLINKTSAIEVNNSFKNNILWYKTFLKKNKLKFRIYNQKGETLKINLVINIFIIAYKLKLSLILITILKKIGVKLG